MTPSQSRFYALLLASPGGVLSQDIRALLESEDDPPPLPVFLRSCRELFTLRSEADEEPGERWYHLKDAPEQKGKRLLLRDTPVGRMYKNDPLVFVRLPKKLRAQARTRAERYGVPLTSYLAEAVLARLKKERP